MKRLTSFLILICLSAGAAAQWTPAMVDPMVITYIDRTTVRGKGGLVRMWWLVDYQLVQVSDEKGYFSRLQHSEYDCKGQRSRLLSVALLSGHMGLGDLVFEDPRARQWEPVQAQPFHQALWDIACMAY